MKKEEDDDDDDENKTEKELKIEERAKNSNFIKTDIFQITLVYYCQFLSEVNKSSLFAIISHIFDFCAFVNFVSLIFFPLHFIYLFFFFSFLLQ